MQTQVGEPTRAFAGQRSDLAPAKVVSAAAEGDVVTGQPVLRGTNKRDQAIPIADGSTVDVETLLGIVLFDPVAHDAVGSGSTVSDEETLDAMREGVTFVHCTGPATAGNAVFVGNTTATLGQIQGTTAVGLVALPTARFVDDAVAGQRARVEINLP